jgi:hypothetical protein
MGIASILTLGIITYRTIKYPNEYQGSQAKTSDPPKLRIEDSFHPLLNIPTPILQN